MNTNFKRVRRWVEQPIEDTHPNLRRVRRKLTIRNHAEYIRRGLIKGPQMTFRQYRKAVKEQRRKEKNAAS